MLDNKEANNKRIAKNTIVLYIRMFITMLVGLYTSRVVLDALGVEDFGLYNLVGGFVAMFSIVQSGLVSASQRFINVTLATGDLAKLRHLFSTIVLIYLILTILAVILVESFGLYFFYHQLNIPDGRLMAAQWTFHLSVITLVVTLMGAPYDALIIAHEKMQVFAYISIFDVIAKLIIAEIIYIVGFDKLIYYTLLLSIESVVVFFLYYLYCHKVYIESKLKLIFDWGLIKEIYSFAIWSMIGGFAFMGFTQGLNVLLGMFFTPVVVAARGIANQVQGVIKTFAFNFQTAVNPQIIKSYAKGDYDYFEKLLIISSKYSFILLYMMTLPFLFRADKILSLWLVEVPPETELYLCIILLTVLFDSMTTPYERAIQASGNIKSYSLTTSLIFLSILPVSYIALKLGAAPYSVFIVQLMITILAVTVRMYMAKKNVNINIILFFKQSLLPVIQISVLSFAPVYLLNFFLPDSILCLLLVIIFSVAIVICITYCLGMTDFERNIVKGFLKNKFIKKIRP